MTRLAPLAALAALTLAAGGLTACEKQIDAPLDRGVCWHAVTLPNGDLKFNKLSEHEPSLESCAAALEAMRLRFQALGSNQGVVTGAYQGQYLFDADDGIFTSQTLKGGRYLFLVRTGDGRLAKASAMPQQ
jgi:hypothetical protein